MDLLRKCAEVYSGYSGFDYIFTLDCGLSFKVAFRASHFHHLAGLHYLYDIAQVDKKRPNNSTVDIYKKIIKGKINHKLIKKSKFYNKIEERLIHLSDLNNVITSKLIVDFDNTKVPKTDLLSKYLLYRQYENGYAILGLKYDMKNDIYIPETFIFSHSDYYVKNQKIYNVIDVQAQYYKRKK